MLFSVFYKLLKTWQNWWDLQVRPFDSREGSSGSHGGLIAPAEDLRPEVFSPIRSAGSSDIAYQTNAKYVTASEVTEPSKQEGLHVVDKDNMGELLSHWQI